MKSKSNKLDYSGQNIYTGLDTHLNSWKASIIVDKTFFKTFSQDPCAKTLSNYLRKNFPGANYYSAYEASFSGFSAHRELLSLGIKNIVVNPADIPTTDKERKQKEDSRDSRKIAEQLASSKLKGIYIPSIDTEGDRALLRLRRTLTKEIVRNKNRVRSHLYFHGVSLPDKYFGNKYWSKRFTQCLLEAECTSTSARKTLTEIVEIVEFLRKKQYNTIKEIRQLAKEQRYKKNVELLMSIPGIALITAMSFLTEIEDISRFKNLEELCSFVGLVPMTNSSGERESVGNITVRQNKILRSLIVESSWIAIRNDAALMLAYQKLIKRMDSNKAIIRIAKKMLNRIRYVLKNQEFYQYGVVK